MAKGAKPKGLHAYLRWFEDRWTAEMPDSMHGLGTFVGMPDRPDRESTLWAKHSTPEQLAGGSHLGSPNIRDPFRRLMENSPSEVEYASYDGNIQVDPHYVRPVRAAIARLSSSRPIVARWLSALAYAGFDWRGLVTRRGWSLEEGELYLEAAMYLLWREFDLQPRERGYAA